VQARCPHHKNPISFRRPSQVCGFGPHGGIQDLNPGRIRREPGPFGQARMVLQVKGTGMIKVHVELPAADPVMDLMLTGAIRLDPDVEIIGIP